MFSSSSFTVSNCYHFYVIIFPCTYFVLSFMLSFLGCYNYHLVLSFILCCHLMLSFLMLSFGLSFGVIIYLMLSFDVIISQSLQMLSFLCYNFSLYSMGVIIYVIIFYYNFPPFFLFPENVTHSKIGFIY